MSTLTTALALILATTNAGGEPAAAPSSYVISVLVLAAPGGDTGGPLAVTSDGATVPLAEMAHGTGTPARAAAVLLGDVRVDLDPAWPTFNGEPDPAPGSGVEILSAPRVTTGAGDRATVRSGTAPPEYFEPGDDGCFRHRRLPPEDSPGLHLSLTPLAAGIPDRVQLDLDLNLTTVGAREPLAGVGLPVGKPTLLRQGLSTRALVEHGRWTVVSAHTLLPAADGPPRVLLLLLRVDPVG